MITNQNHCFMKKSIIFFTILLMLGIGLLNPLQAQTQMVKTLDDPGSTPVLEFKIPNGILIVAASLKGNDGSSLAATTINFTNSPPSITFLSDAYKTIMSNTDSEFRLTESTILSEPYEQYHMSFTWDAYELSQSSTHDVSIYPFFGPQAKASVSLVGSGALVPSVYGTKGTPITFTAEELAILNDANGRSFIMRQTATNATSVVNIPAQADAAAIGQAIKTAAAPHTIYIQPEIQDDGSLKTYADEAFTLEGDEILSTQWQEAFGQNIALYPNPATDVLHLDYDTAKEIEYGIYNLAGQRVQTVKSKGTQHNLNVSELAPGMYVLEAMGESQKTHFRFVKN